MEFFLQADSILRFFVTIGLLFGGGVASFFIIRSQLRKSLEDTINTLQGELDVYKGKTDRLENELRLLKVQYDDVKMKKNYLKQLILEALQKQTNIKDFLGEALINPKK